MSGEVFQLAILLSVKDVASGSLDRFRDRLKAMGKDGEIAIQRLDKIRDNLNRDFAIGGIGIGGLALLKKQVDVAGDYEATLLDLKNAYAESNVEGARSAEQQKKDLKELSELATRLGDQLQGGTSDYVKILTAMKKAGTDVETILDGAGESAAYLANVSGTLTSGGAAEQAKELGQYSKMFDLRGKQVKDTVQLFSALKDRFDIDSSELIEGSKYFLSTGKAIGLTGSDGAADIAKLLAFSKRYTGYEGSRSGTNLDAIITQFLQHGKARESLKKDTGIDIQLFDKKGQFKGIENMFAEFEKLRKLNPQKRLESLTAIFGQEGGRIAGSMVEQGVAGWKNITAETSKAVPVQDKINAQMQTYNAKMEALTGSFTNFRAVAFTPLMDDTKSILDGMSNVVTVLQKFAQENPGIAKTVTEILAVGSAALVAYSGVKTLMTGFKLLRLAAAVSKGGDGLTAYLQGIQGESNKASTSIAATEKQAKGLRGALNGKWSAAITITSILVAEYALNAAIQKAFEAAESKMEAQKSTNASQSAWEGYKNQLQQQGQRPTPQDYEFKANVAWATSINGGLWGALRTKTLNDPFFSLTKRSIASQGIAESIGYPISYATGAVNPFASGFGGRAIYGQTFGQGFKQTAPALADSDVMAQFLKQLSARVPDKQEQEQVKAGLKEAFPESFMAAMAKLAQDSNQIAEGFNIFSTGLQSLNQPLDQTGKSVFNFGSEVDKTPPSLSRFSNSVNTASSSLNSLSFKISSWQPPSVSVPPVGGFPLSNQGGGGGTLNLIRPGGYAVGGSVERSGLAVIHAGEDIVPAKVARGYKGGGGGGVTIHAPMNVTIHGGGASAKKEFSALLFEHRNQISQMVSRAIDNGRVRA
jgi:TP901 family phage tail tape measure protein